MVGRIVGLKGGETIRIASPIGRSVRAERSIGRETTAPYLREKLTPQRDPVGAVTERMMVYKDLEPRAVYDELMDRYERLPSGSPNTFDWLKSQAESGKIMERMNPSSYTHKNNDGTSQDIQVYQHIPVWAKDPEDGRSLGAASQFINSPDDARGIALDRPDSLMAKPGVQFYTSVIAPSNKPYLKADILAHELGHVTQQHALYDKLPENTSLREAEAEAIRYGVMNRIYPWESGGTLDRAALHPMNQVDTWDYATGREEVMAHLSDRGVQNRINSSIAAIVPVPRQPFRGIITPDSARVNSVRDAYVREQTAEERYKARMDELYSQGLYQ
jgi:hypothetical protein